VASDDIVAEQDVLDEWRALRVSSRSSENANKEELKRLRNARSFQVYVAVLKKWAAAWLPPDGLAQLQGTATIAKAARRQQNDPTTGMSRHAQTR
jgi:hypothetical protein